MTERPRNVPMSLGAALRKAREDLVAADPAVMAGKAHVECWPGKDGRSQIAVPYYGEWYVVDYPEGTISMLEEQDVPADRRSGIPTITEVLLLHYLLTASGADLTGQWVSYRELPQGSIYERAFQQRAIAPLEGEFGYNLEAFIAAGIAAGGERARLGDASFYFRVLPRMPLMCVLWLGDDEVPPGANILFDGAAAAYLPDEDLAYVGTALAGRLLGAKRGALLT